MPNLNGTFALFPLILTAPHAGEEAQSTSASSPRARGRVLAPRRCAALSAEGATPPHHMQVGGAMVPSSPLAEEYKPQAVPSHGSDRGRRGSSIQDHNDDIVKPEMTSGKKSKARVVDTSALTGLQRASGAASRHRPHCAAHKPLGRWYGLDWRRGHAILLPSQRVYHDSWVRADQVRNARLLLSPPRRQRRGARRR